MINSCDLLTNAERLSRPLRRRSLPTQAVKTLNKAKEIRNKLSYLERQGTTDKTLLKHKKLSSLLAKTLSRFDAIMTECEKREYRL